MVARNPQQPTDWARLRDNLAVRRQRRADERTDDFFHVLFSFNTLHISLMGAVGAIVVFNPSILTAISQNVSAMIYQVLGH